MKAVEWGVLVNQIYLYGLKDTFEVDTDHKPLLLLFASHKVTAPLRIERMRVRLQGFDYKLNYIPGKKAKAETNEADYNSRHPEPFTMPDPRAVHQTEFTVREDEELFEKDIRAVVQGTSGGYKKQKNISGPGSGFQVWTGWWKPTFSTATHVK